MAAGRETTFRGHALGYMKRLPCNFDRTSEKYNVPFSYLASVARSQRDPCQLLMVPLSPQTGHHHTMASVSGSRSVPIAPAQGFRLGRRRHFTGVFPGSSQGSVVTSTTIFVRYSASFLAGPDIGPIAPFSMRKCVRSVTQVFPIHPFP